MVVAQQISRLLTSVRGSIRGFIPLVVLIVLTVVGGIIFVAIEAPHEIETITSEIAKQKYLLDNTAFRLNTIKSMTPIEAYNHTVQTLVSYREKLGVPEPSLNNTKWHFWGAVYYSMTVYTTIGYGNIAAETGLGRFFTIVYAFIGIPIALLALIGLGSLFAKVCTLVWSTFLHTVSCFNPKVKEKLEELGPEKAETETESVISDDLLRFPLSFIFVLTVLWVLFCALVFSIKEDWNYGTSLYFTLISFLTIGFGDVLPSSTKDIVLIGILLLVGLALVSTLIQIIQSQIEALASGMKDSIDKEYQVALQEACDSGEIELSDVPLSENDTNRAVVESAENIELGPKKTEKNEDALEKILKRMPWQKRMMYHIMPAGEKKKLHALADQRSRYKSTATQTDDSLLKAAVVTSGVGEPRVTSKDGEGTVLWIQKQ